MSTARTVADDGGSDGGNGLASFRRNIWWGLAGTVACVLGFAVGDWVLDPAVPAGLRALTGLSTAATIVTCGVLLGRRIRDEAPSTGWLVTASCVTGVAAAVPLALGNFGIWSIAPAAMLSVLVMFLPARRAWAVLGAALLVLPTVGLITALAMGEPDVGHAVWMPALMVLAFGPAMLGMLRGWQVAARLDDARRLAGQLAVADERLRFAADLHDIQGHHLQVIALKSELAARLAEADPARAAEQIREVQHLAGDALRETRALVQGYRRTTLDAEIANASKVLAAAGVEVLADVDTGLAAALPEAPRSLLGLVVREATTNLLRHSRATRAAIVLLPDGTGARLLIDNDGARPARPDEEARPGGRPAGAGDGTGLVSLAERLDAVGGHLSWTGDGDRFVVTATVAG
ncbi:two-component system, NarL family, sensor histidine kinase DesK [Promicromonospora umidemergens]|uniref:Histidine kinase n=1 Tax=Promicromonospora umidemergens TaxID=629679 RepID=A0ABP8WIH5_9MICO|nr:histidine kinase [Promicromonospora umidemergens]MCP2284131.1 two-component system, NarL family, sensor histidine kinase DesK [Promicromonospora umidemergens]